MRRTSRVLFLSRKSLTLLALSTLLALASYSRVVVELSSDQATSSIVATPRVEI